MPEQELSEKRQRDEDGSAAGSAKKPRIDGAGSNPAPVQHAAGVKVEPAWQGPDGGKDTTPTSNTPQPMKIEGAAAPKPAAAVAPAAATATKAVGSAGTSAWSSPEMQALRLKAVSLPLNHQQAHQQAHHKPLYPPQPQPWKPPAAPVPAGPPPPGWSNGPGMWGAVPAASLNFAAGRQYSAREIALQDVDLEHWRSEPVVVPSYAAWFELNAVHDLERQALPDVVGSAGSREEAEYKRLRNQVVLLYRDAPHKVLSAADALAHVPAAADVVVRVHALLEYWGLVNAEADGRVRMAKAMERVKAAEERTVKRCAVTGQPLQRVYFHHPDAERHPNMLLSPNAYAHGLLPPTLCLHDFKRKAAIDAATPNMPSFSDWTEDESARLLDAVLKAGDAWDVVAQYVGGKTIAECVLQLARLPIADPYLPHPIPNRGTAPPPVLPQTLDPETSAQLAFPFKWRPAWADLLADLLRMLAHTPDALPALDAAAAALPAAPHGAAAAAAAACSLPPPDAERFEAIAARAPWLHALQWPPPHAPPRVAEGSLVVILSEEAGRFRGRVTCVRRAKAGVMDVELCGGRVCTLQLRRAEYRVLLPAEVTAIEAALGCPLLHLSAAEQKHEVAAAAAEEGAEEGPLDPVGKREERALSKLAEAAAVWHRLRAKLKRQGDAEGLEVGEAVECAVAAVALRVATYERQEEEVRELRWRAEAARRRETEDACRLLAQSPEKRSSTRPPRRRAFVNALGDFLNDGEGRSSPMALDGGDDGG